jgi:hypothetical protein
MMRIIMHLGKHLHRHTQQTTHFLIPTLLADVVEHRPTSIGHVRGMNLPTRQAPDQETIDGAKRKLTFQRALAPPTLSRIQASLVPEK